MEIKYVLINTYRELFLLTEINSVLFSHTPIDWWDMRLSGHVLFNLNIIQEVLAIRRIFSLVDMITNTKFSNCPSVFKMGVVQQ